jgi:hypothetical protein|tara:strand:- start:139 stop:393 length:255 start_codon:yes stop_codon:yes gene_type:complete
MVLSANSDERVTNMTDIILSNLTNDIAIPDLFDDSEWTIVINDEPENEDYYEYCTCHSCLGDGGNAEPACGADEQGRFYIGDQE